MSRAASPIPDMYRVVAQTGLEYIAMHWRGPQQSTWTTSPHYDDVVADVRNELKQRLAEMIVWGIDPAKVILDPGLGLREDRRPQLGAAGGHAASCSRSATAS